MVSKVLCLQIVFRSYVGVSCQKFHEILPIEYDQHRPKFLLRSGRPDVFCEKVVLRSFVKFTGKHLCQSLFFNKVAGLLCNRL